jgi:AcrR family transcriptional regulator
MTSNRQSARKRPAGQALTDPKPAQDAKTRLIQAAELLFSEKGFDATSTKSVAENAGVPVGLLFYYFPSKATLLAAVLERNNLALSLRRALREPGEAETGQQVLLEALTSLLVFIEKNHRWAALFFRELLADREGSDVIRLQRIEGLKFFASWLDRNLGGSNHKFNHSAVAAHILGASLMVAALVDRPKNKKAFAANLISLMMHGGLGRA